MFNDKEAVEHYNEAHRQGVAFWNPFLQEAEKDLRISMGDQWKAADATKLKNEFRHPFVFNKTKRLIRLISGYQRKNRLALKVEPVEGSDEQTADQLSGLILHIMQACNGYHTMSEAFMNGPLKTGINLIDVYPDFQDDPLNSDIKLGRIPYNKFMLDPFFSNRDLSDCSWVQRREYFTKDQVKALLPMRAAAIEKLPDKDRDDKFVMYQPPFDITGEKLMSYDEFWVRAWNKSSLLVDRETGHTMPDLNPAKVKLLMKAFPNLELLPTYKKTIELYILVNGVTMWKGADPYGLEDFPFVPLMGFWDPEYNESHWKLQSLIRCMRDPQDETNKRRSKILDMIDSQISSGWKAEEGSVVNPSSMYQSGQGKVVWMNEDKFEKAIPLDIPDIPQGMFRLMEVLDKDIIEIPGGTGELMGAPAPGDAKLQMSGVLGKLRQGAALVGFQDFFDDYRLAKSLVGRKIVKLIQSNYTPEKVQRILNEPPAQEFYKKDFGKYDCVPQEGVLSDTQRQMYYAELLNLKEMQAPIPWSAILDAAPIQHKSKLKEFMKQAEDQAAKDAQYDKLMERLSAALIQAETASKIAGEGEKRTQAIENQAGAALDRIKAMREMEQIDEKSFLEILKTILAIEKMGEVPKTAGQKPAGQSPTK